MMLSALQANFPSLPLWAQSLTSVYCSARLAPIFSSFKQ